MSEPLPVEPTPGALAFGGHGDSARGGRRIRAGESGPDPGPPAHVAAGQLVVEHVPLLRSHAGTPPDMVLTWNAMESPGAMDVVVHLHGSPSRGRWMQLPADIVPVSGLDFTDPRAPVVGGPDQPDPAGLPRGNFFGGRSGRGYDFPALHPPGALKELVDDARGPVRRAGRRQSRAWAAHPHRALGRRRLAHADPALRGSR